MTCYVIVYSVELMLVIMNLTCCALGVEETYCAN